MKSFRTKMRWTAIVLAGALLATAQSALPAPTINIVPGSPVNVNASHEVLSGRPTTLKAAVSPSCAGVCTWDWNPGDGSAHTTGNVAADPTASFQLDDPGFYPYWAVWAEHSYVGAAGTVYIATLTVNDGSGPATATYRVEIVPSALSREVNAAIDEALWHMHRMQLRFLANETGLPGGTIPMGSWDYPQYFGQVVPAVSAASVNAFEANGWLQAGSGPYAETVARGLKYVISQLITQPMTIQTLGDTSGSGRSDNPDSNGNGLGITVNSVDMPYQSGMIMDAIVASGTPGALAQTGSAGVITRSYGAIIQDMTDWYAWAQTDSTQHGGWQYGPFDNNAGAHDNSASGWAAVGVLAAEDKFGATVPSWVTDRNQTGLEFTDNESDNSDVDGVHGYTNSPSPIWGPYGVTGAALVQMDMDDVQATSSATPDERWIRSENYFRRHFNDTVTGDNFKNYYYGMFNFAKAMRLARPGPVVDVGMQVGFAQGGVGCGPSTNCAANGPQVLDWYNDATNGLARTIVDYQILSNNPNTSPSCGAALPGPCPNMGGFTDRPGNSQGSNQDDFNTPWATQILTRTILSAGPVAIASASPNPTGEGVSVTFDGTASFHQDPNRQIVLYEWDFDGDNAFDASGAIVQHAFSCVPPGNLPCEVPVTLRVTDNGSPALTAEDVVVIHITVPPHPPVADADGSYIVCSNEPLVLDGSGSFDIDEGESETGQPPFDTIIAYEWDLNLASGPPFDVIGAVGVQPNVSYATPGTRDIALRVTDNTALAFPGAGQPNLTDTDSSTATVADCSCIGPISVRAKPKRIQLVWTPVPGAASYDINRSSTGPNSGFALRKANHVTHYATYLDRVLDNSTYWYRITPKNASGQPICGSSVAVSAAAGGRPPRR